MSDTNTFINQGRFQFTVKRDWYIKMSNGEIKPEEYNVYDLMNQFKMKNFLHNTIGPAIIDLKTGNQTYMIDGKPLTEEDSKKMRHTMEFNNAINGLLND